jgi:hypothetical protein
MKKNILLMCLLFSFCSVNADNTRKSTTPEKKSEVATEMETEAATPVVGTEESDNFFKIILDTMKQNPEAHLEVAVPFAKYEIQLNVEHIHSGYIKAVSMCLSKHISGLPKGNELKPILEELNRNLQDLINYKKIVLGAIGSGKVNREHPFSDLGDPLVAGVYGALVYINIEQLERILSFCLDLHDKLKKSEQEKKIQTFEGEFQKIADSLRNFIDCVKNLEVLKDKLSAIIDKGTVLEKYPDLNNLKAAVSEVTDLKNERKG